MKTTLEELKAFITIVEKGSISLAAEELEQTPSGISRTLSRLEEKLDVTLLRRTTRRIDLTSEGEVFLLKARNVLQVLTEAEESVGSITKPTGVLRVDSASPFILHAVVPYMSEFGSLYPDVSLELFSSERNVDLLENRIDVAIRMGHLSDSSMHAVKLGVSRRRILASSKYIKKFGMPKSIQDLDNHRLIGFTDPRDLNLWPLRSATGERLRIRPHLSASSGETILQLVNSGAGIACLSDFMTANSLKNGSLAQVLTSETLEEKEQIHAIYYKNNKLSQRADVFIKFLKEKLKAAL